jgi:NifU-like protein involved in Fe-S cluster formation
MAYSDKVIDHYENPRNVGSFDKGDDSIGTGKPMVVDLRLRLLRL